MKCIKCEKDKGSMIKIQLYEDGVKVNKENFVYEDDFLPHFILCEECVFDMILNMKDYKGFTTKYSEFDEGIVGIFGKSLS